MSRDSRPLVFSTDAAERLKGETPAQAEVEIVPAKTVLRLRLEKKGRKSKTVTLLSDLPPNATYWSELLKRLKAMCGTGGTLKEGQLEVQGDQVAKVRAYLEQLGFRVR